MPGSSTEALKPKKAAGAACRELRGEAIRWPSRAGCTAQRGPYNFDARASASCVGVPRGVSHDGCLKSYRRRGVVSS